MIRLSGQFHLLLAEFAGNGTLTGILAGLIDRSGLAIAAFERRNAHTCSAEDHRRLIDALAGTGGHRDGCGCGDAAALMMTHLDAVEAQLDLDATPDTAVDLKSIFAEEA